MRISLKPRLRGGFVTRALLGLISRTMGRPKPLPEKLERILVAVVAGIGDCLLATPAIRSIRKRYPEARLVLLTNSRSEELLKGWPAVDEIIALDVDYLLYAPSGQGWYRPKGFRHIWQTLRRLRRERFDLAINLKEVDSLRGAVLMGFWLKAVGARYRAGRDTDGRGVAFHLRAAESQRDGRHAVVKNLAVAEALGCEADPGPLSLHIPQEDRQAAEDFVSAWGPLTGPLVALHPWVKKTEKQWPIDFWARVIEELVSRFEATVVVLGGSDDTQDAERLGRTAPENVVVASGTFSLGQTAALIERADIFLGVDSGPSHMAAAVGTPTVACYLPKNVDVFAPYTDPARYRVLAPDSPKAPLSEIPPEAVIEAAGELLERGKATPPEEVLPWFSPGGERDRARRRSVAHIITRLDRGGSPQNTLLTVLGLDPSLYRATLITGLTTAPTPMMNRLLDRRDIDLIFVPSLIRPLSPVSDLRALWALYRICRRGEFDMVHTHGSKAGIIGRWAAWLAGCRLLVHTCHGSVFSGYAGRLFSRLFVYAERLTARITQQIITLTPEGAEEFLAFDIAPEEKFASIPSGVEVERFSPPAEHDKALARQKMGLPREGPIVGSVGRLDWIKGYDLLVEASALVLRKRPDVLFAVAGDGHEREALEELTRRLRVAHRWRFLGWRDELELIYKAFDLSVLPSRNEGMGRTAVEAMACGLPVVATAVGGLPYVVEDGVTGLLVKPDSPRALAGAILKFIEDEAALRRMGLAGPKRARERFSHRMMLDDIHRIYARLFNASGHRPP